MKTRNMTVFSLALLLMFSNAFGCICNASEETAHVYLSPSVVSADSIESGDTFEISIQVDNVTNLWSWGLNLSWNPDVLELVGDPVEGTFLNQGGSTLFIAAPVDDANGSIPSISCNLLSYSGTNGSGLLATVDFQIVNSGSSDITIDWLELYSNDEGDSIAIPATSEGSAFNSTSPDDVPTFDSPIILIVALATTGVLIVMVKQKLKNQL
jgi:hypothetical protein